MYNTFLSGKLFWKRHLHNGIYFFQFHCVENLLLQCFKLAEDYEEDIEEWYYNRQDQNLAKYICRDRYLVGKDQSKS